jgi:hypothetical protein
MKAFANNKKYLRSSNQNWIAVVDLKIRGSLVELRYSFWPTAICNVESTRSLDHGS